MKKHILFVLFFLGLFTQITQAQYVSEIIEYQPAPGQLINTENFGSLNAAQSIIGGTNGLVSLGAFGGYIILKMEEPIENHPLNPNGVDFTIFGNAMNHWSEAGAVYVMKDENQNGLADDEWFLLAGSDDYWSDSQGDYHITYFNGNDDILWIDQNQDSGFIFRNGSHPQNYYPESTYFPNIDPQQENYDGPLITGFVDRSNASFIRSYSRVFGYADNHPRGDFESDLPDNPYTPEIENMGGDAMDISWARNANGQAVSLDQIDFIKITTAINNHGGYLGEISTEISGIMDIQPNAAVSGLEDCIVIKDLSSRLLVNSQVQIEALQFHLGIPLENQSLVYETSDESIAEISSQGFLECYESGNIEITVKAADDPEIGSSISLEIITPNYLEWVADYSQIEVHQATDLGVIIKDQNHQIIEDLEVIWETSNEEIFSINLSNNSPQIFGEQAGQAYLKATIVGFENLKDSVLVSVVAPNSNPFVYFSVKIETQNLIPRQAFSISKLQLNSFVHEAQMDYSPNDDQPLSLAHVIASVYKELGLENELKFRDDLPDQELYLWKLPFEENNSLEYFYGYGGLKVSPYQRCWLAKVNGETFANQFDNIPVYQGDEIMLFHISDVSQIWNVNQLSVTNDSLDNNELLQLKLQIFEQKLEDDKSISQLSVQDVYGTQIFLDNAPLSLNGNWVLTDESGLAEFPIAQTGLHEVSADLNKSKVFAKGATGISEQPKNGFAIFPNPNSTAFLQIQIPKNENLQEASLFSSSGQLIWIGSQNRIPSFQLPCGIYFISIKTDQSSFTTRFIRN